MKRLQLDEAFTLMESGPVVFITTNNGERDNVMTISWTMVMDFRRDCLHTVMMQERRRGPSTQWVMAHL